MMHQPKNSRCKYWTFCNELQITVTGFRHTLRIDSIEEDKRSLYSYSGQHRVFGARETQEDPMTRFTIRTMSLTEQDKHDLQLNPSTIPSPRFRFEHVFQLPQGYTIICVCPILKRQPLNRLGSRRAQLLPSDRLLLIVADRLGNLTVYLESLTGIDGAVSRRRGKQLNREKIGQDFVLAFDESKRMLSVVSSDKVRIPVLHGSKGVRDHP